MLTYKARIATNNLDMNLMRFSEEALDDLTREQKVRVVRDSPLGEPVGFTEKIERDETGVLVTLKIKPVNLDERWFVVPAGVCDNDDIKAMDDYRLVTHISLVSLMLTLNPADPTLTPIERGDDENHS